jgi:hypothetical protein
VDSIRKALRGTGGCAVEIRVPTDTEARAVAKRLHRIFDSCGYATAIIAEPESDSPPEGVQLLCSPENAQSGLAIQSAFQSAGIDVLLTVHQKARNKVVVQLGRGPLV